MELMNVLQTRRSIRKYTDRQIPEETLRKILQAGLLAPTSRNLKPWEFYVIRDSCTLAQLSESKNAGAGMLAGCDAAIAVFADSGKADTWVEDCSIAMSFMMLMAEEEGVGCCWVQIHLRSDGNGTDAEKKVREILELPERFRIAGILSLGIPADRPKAHIPEEIDWGKVHIIGENKE